MDRKNQVIGIVFIIIFILLFIRLIQLQVAEKMNFSMLAIENAGKVVPEPAPRGIIYDRNGKVIVENRPVFSVRVLPYVLANKTKTERERILSTLNQLLGQVVKLKVSATEPLVVKDNITLNTAIKIKEQSRDLDGVVLTSRPVRLYPNENLAAHVLGHVGEIESDELKRMWSEGYRLGDIIGKDGVEKTYDQIIRGRDGGKKIEVDVYGNPLRIIESLDPLPGADMYLTIDMDLQKVVEKSLGDQEGAVVVIDLVSGEVLALASHPNYDPNIFADPFRNWKWKELGEKNHPFMNRALSVYPPGSIFKIITLTAALEEGFAEPDEIIDCHGSYKVKNRIAKCWLEQGHGKITVKEGLVWSCDVVFYELGKRVGPDILTKYATEYGLGSLSGIDLPQEKSGFLPTKRWKEKEYKIMWYDGDSINYGIGQGFLQVTPIQMTLAYGALATGKVYQPYVVKEIRNEKGEKLYQGETKVISTLSVSAETLSLIRKMLREVIKRGTGVAANVPGLPAEGKTGTAENPREPHAWFMCYAPNDKPEIVIGSFVAHGEHGDRASAYIARDILWWYKKNRLNKVYQPEPYIRQYILQQDKYKVPYRGIISNSNEDKESQTAPAAPIAQ